MITSSISVSSSTFIHHVLAGKHQTVVFYGTSLTEGGAWIDQLKTCLAERYSAARMTFINSGMSGKNSADGAVADTIRTKVLDLNPDVVFLEFAINDAKSMTVAQSKGNLLGMISAIRAQREETEIILMTMNSCWDAPNSSRPASLRPNLAAYYQNYRDVARDERLLLIDHYPNWIHLQKNHPATFRKYVPDGLHPVADGYAAIVTPVIAAALISEAQ